MNTVFIYSYTDTGSLHYLNNSDFNYIKSLKGVEIISPRINYSQFTTVKFNNDSMLVNLLGEGALYFDIENLTPLKGRPVTETDIQNQNLVCYIGYSIFTQLHCDTGDYVLVEDVPFKVCGVFKSNNNKLWDKMRNNSVFIPYTSLQQAFSIDNRYDQFSLVLNENKSDIISEIETYLQTYEKTNSQFNIYDYGKEYGKITSVQQSYVTIKWLLFIFVMLIAGAGMYFLLFRTISSDITSPGIHIKRSMLISFFIGGSAFIFFVLIRIFLWSNVLNYTLTNHLLCSTVIFNYIAQVFIVGVLPVGIKIFRCKLNFNK